MDVIGKAMDSSPWLRRLLVQQWYKLLARLDRDGVVTFMNYGYADVDRDITEPDRSSDGSGQDHYSIQLYEHVLSGLSLSGCDVLEVGCGRGGGAAHVARVLSPKSLVGLDSCVESIAFCTDRHVQPELTFTVGYAEDLPFPEESFDVVINIESSHCYSSVDRFSSEVARVLRPGGHFLLADFRPRDQIGGFYAQLRGDGMQVIASRSITANIVRALELDSQRKRRLIDDYVPRILRRRFGSFAALPGSPLFEQFSTGSSEYHSLVLRKDPAHVPPPPSAA